MNAGSVKVGRWHYPALENGDGTVVRNSKRDGSGEWSDTNPVLFVPVGDGDPAAEKVASAEVIALAAGGGVEASKARHPAGKAKKGASAPVVEGFTEEPSLTLVQGGASKNGHGGKAGAQTKKPGKSTWEVGSTCPRGDHVITDADGDNPVYEMPSGRKQCRACRRGYGSNK